MNREIEIFDLITLIENNKAPKKIKWHDKLFTYDKEMINYVDEEGEGELFGYYINNIFKIPVEKFEILDQENDEFEDINENGPYRYEITNDDFQIDKMNCNFISYKEYIEQLIRNQKKIINEIERLKKDE